MIPTQEVAILIILWFFTGRQFGHVSAKYARAKKSSRIIAVGLMLLSIAASIAILLKA